MNWEREGVDLPVLFRKSDLEELSLQKDKFFARKFDTNIDEEILNLIDKTML